MINICGMAGIGKSFLVKHLALKLMNEEDVVVIYIDVRYVYSVKNIFVTTSDCGWQIITEPLWIYF